LPIKRDELVTTKKLRWISLWTNGLLGTHPSTLHLFILIWGRDSLTFSFIPQNDHPS
jgi:hypothetical protein